MTATAWWVVPCYNEESRLDAAVFRAFVDAEPAVALLFVNDGSADQTEARLNELASSRPSRIRVLSLPQNRGKGEAVRLGMLDALSGGASFVGYFDADLATPTSEIARLTRVLQAREMDVVLGARVALLGRRVQRSMVRHFLGRAFATCASLVLELPVYDTQCGAKLFRRTPALMTALARPFHSRWLFDVELLGRLTVRSPGIGRVLEEPLDEWRDVPGSKLRAKHFVLAVAELAQIARDLRSLRRSGMAIGSPAERVERRGGLDAVSDPADTEARRPSAKFTSTV